MQGKRICLTSTFLVTKSFFCRGKRLRKRLKQTQKGRNAKPFGDKLVGAHNKKRSLFVMLRKEAFDDKPKEEWA